MIRFRFLFLSIFPFRISGFHLTPLASRHLEKRLYAEAMAQKAKSCDISGKFSTLNEVRQFSVPWKSSDLVLKVADRKFHVHRAVLILCSPVFETMLSSDFKEKTAKEISLPGKDATEIEQMLRGIYPDQDLFISKENCLALLKLSTEYQIDRLNTRCQEYLRHWCTKYDKITPEMTVDEALEVIIVSQRFFVEEYIVESCVHQFVENENRTWEEMQQHIRYSELEPDTVKRLTEERVKYLEKMLKMFKIGHKTFGWQNPGLNRNQLTNINYFRV